MDRLETQIPKSFEFLQIECSRRPQTLDRKEWTVKGGGTDLAHSKRAPTPPRSSTCPSGGNGGKKEQSGCLIERDYILSDTTSHGT